MHNYNAKSVIKSYVVSLIVGSFILSSCVGGSGDSTPPQSKPTKSWSAYSGSIYILDNDNPSSTKEKIFDGVIKQDNSKYFWFSTPTANSLDITNNAYTGLRFGKAIFLTRTGDVYMVDLSNTGVKPSPIKYSSLSGVCSVSNFEDFLDLYAVVEDSGNDRDCSNNSDNRRYLILATDTPTAINLGRKNVLYSWYANPSNPISGFVIQDESGDIKNCDIKLNNCKNIVDSSNRKISSANIIQTLGRDELHNKAYICVDNYLYKIDNSSNIGYNLGDCNPLSYGYYSDTKALYWVDQDSNNSQYSIKRVNFSDDRISPIYTSSNKLYIEKYTDNYIVFSEYATYRYKAVVRKDGTESPIYLTSNDVSSIFTYKNYLFFNEYDDSHRSYKACYWKEGMSSTDCKDNSKWIAFTTLKNGTLDINSENWLPVDKIVRADNVSFQSSGDYFSCPDIKVVSITNPLATGTLLGSIGTDFGCPYDAVLIYGDKGLVNFKYRGGNEDIFLVDTVNNKITNLTNTNDKSEKALTSKEIETIIRFAERNSG